MSSRRRVLIEGENLDESFYIEEIIEESEEESDDMDNFGRDESQSNFAGMSMSNQTKWKMSMLWTTYNYDD